LLALLETVSKWEHFTAHCTFIHQSDDDSEGRLCFQMIEFKTNH
jgi:hypothetical protein